MGIGVTVGVGVIVGFGVTVGAGVAFTFLVWALMLKQ